ncbi:PAS domain S-box protein [Mesobacillus foraminis]|uniref:PAS domain S-box protein n=1 Tax=Mesobacillus foraminis TaxID=279826 RepID=UPI000EF46AB8|nr:PAS domain S-box protein [Mesobacillus foraminis]
MEVTDERHFDKTQRTEHTRMCEMKSMLDLHSFLIQKITNGDSLYDILKTLTLKLEGHFKRKMYCSIMLAANEGKLALGTAPNLPQDFIQAIQCIKVGPKAGACGTAVYLNEPVISSDIEKDPLWEGGRNAALRHGLRACWSIPISVGGRAEGTFAFYFTDVCTPSSFELEMLKTCANLAGFAVERDKRNELENQLRESKQRFKSLFDYYPDSIHMVSLEGTFLGFNRGTESIFGYSQEELLGKSFILLTAPDYQESALFHFNEAKKGKVQQFEYKIIHKNGHEVFLHTTFLPIFVKGKVQGVYGISRDMAYEKKLEQELDVSHREVEQLMKDHQGMIYKFKKENGQFIHTMGTGQLLKKLGINVKESIGRTLYDIFPEEIADWKNLHYQKAWNGIETTYESDYKGIYYVGSLKPIYQNGNIVEVIGSCNDVTELRKTHEDLRATKELLESFINNTVDAIATMNPQGEITFVNQAYIDMFGFPEDEVIGKKIANIPEKYKDEFERLFKTVASGKKIKGYETVRHRANGTLVPVSITHSPIKDKNGVVTGVSGIIRDITEKKSIEQELEENKQRYQSLFLANPDLVLSLDVKGNVTNINPSVEKLIGYTPEQVLGQSYAEFIEKETLNKTRDGFKKALQGIPQTYETKLIHKNGTSGIFQVTNLPIIVNNKIVGVYGIAKDISQNKRTEEYLRKSDRLSAIGQLAAGIAHEIRNPLTSIKGFLQLMIEKSSNKEYYQIMLREIDRIELITNEFLILAKPQAKKYCKKSITAILGGFLPLVETQANMRNIEIITEIDELLPAIYCDANQIKQVFLNVMKNAIESMPKGGQITMKVKRNEESLLISIEDQGCGISSERLKRIGEPFYSTKEKGTGLGLMIIFNIIKEHQGTIQITSQLHKGTKVQIRLPYIQ